MNDRSFLRIIAADPAADSSWRARGLICRLGESSATPRDNERRGAEAKEREREREGGGREREKGEYDS